MFIDFTQVELFAGKGGAGAVSFRKEKYIPKGGPDGGDGGRGGHVLFKVDTGLHTLHDIRYRKKYQAENGHHGGGSNKTGRNGTDILIPIPPGTLIRRKNEENFLADLTKDGQSFIACHGGQGGKGNARYKTATQRAPRTFQKGTPGESGFFDIELKILADVGLVGFPNSGKSTLLSKLSAAKPKIAEYPFTTLEPQLGIVKSGDYNSFVMADIPGLIKGASDGKGLGIQFLKHIERNKIHIYIIDVQEKFPADTLEALKKELAQFNQNLLRKPYLICRSKMDLDIDLSDGWKSFSHEFTDISAINGQGLSELVQKIVKLIELQN